MQDGEDRGTSRNCALAQTVLAPKQDSLEFLMAPSEQPHTTLCSCHTDTPRVRCTCCISKDQAQVHCSFGPRMAMLGSLGESKEREERDCACSLYIYSGPHIALLDSHPFFCSSVTKHRSTQTYCVKIRLRMLPAIDNLPPKPREHFLSLA